MIHHNDAFLLIPFIVTFGCTSLANACFTKSDNSTEFAAGSQGSGVRLSKVPNEKQKLEGKILEIRPPRADYGLQAWYNVVLEGDGEIEQRSFFILLPQKVPLPFGKGEQIAVNIRMESHGPHRISHANITNKAGQLLLAHSDDGDLSYAPGWTMKRGPVNKREKQDKPGYARMQHHQMALSIKDRTALIASGKWRKLSTPHGTWLVTATGISWSKGKKVPDSSTYSTYTIVRMPIAHQKH